MTKLHEEPGWKKGVQQNFPIPYHPSWEIQDSTKIQCYQSCPRMYFFEYVLGWRSSYPNNHLWFGACVHDSLEHIILNGYRVQSIIEAMEMFKVKYRSVFPESTDAVFMPKTPDRFFEMLILYIKEYSNDLDRYEVYKTEIGGTVPLSERHRIAFKMDTILYDRKKQKYCSLEHKTKGGNYIGDTYRYDFMLGTQVGTYTHVLNTFFPRDEVSEVIINCLCFKKTKQPGYIFARFPIPLSDPQMYVWLENTKMWLDAIEEDYLKLMNMDGSEDTMPCFKMNTRSCTNWSRVCTYHDLCTSWENPVAHKMMMPADMDISFWNPLEEELRETFEL